MKSAASTALISFKVIHPRHRECANRSHRWRGSHRGRTDSQVYPPIEMPWILPGVPPTGKRVEIAIIVVVQFEDGKVAGERIYWDQASVLAQIGLIDAEKLPVTRIEASRKVVDPAHEPSNSLIKRAGQ